jgi:hypothetical protein
MSKRVRSKTSRKAPPPNKSNRTPEKVREQAHKELAKSDADLIIFERAIALFNAGRFQAAKESFAELAVARNRDLAHSAALRIRICDQRLAQPENPTE